MARTRAQDTRHLEMHHRKWRVSVHVPPHLQSIIGKSRLKRPLNTDSLAIANQKKHLIVAELHAELDKAEAALAGRESAVVEQALDDRQSFQDMRFAQEKEEFLDTAFNRIGDQSGPKTPNLGKARFETYVSVLTGKGTPLAIKLKDYLREAELQPRTEDDMRRALDVLTRWCGKTRVKAEIETLTDDHANKFFEDIDQVVGRSLSAVTKRKYKGNLSVYWRYLKRKKLTKLDIWADVEIKVRKKLNDERERPFTQTEMAALFMAPCPAKLRDVMLVGALSGARLDAIVDLKVGDIVADCIAFKAQKKESGQRFVPQHNDLKAMLAKRCEGKKPSDDLFPEWPHVKAKGSLRERSFRTTKEFTAFRRKVGVDEVVDGNRRSRVNFHSFRRWFITRMDRAGVDSRIRDAITGHKRQGVAEGIYSEGPDLDAARIAISKIALPSLDGSAQDELSVLPRRIAI